MTLSVKWLARAQQQRDTVIDDIAYFLQNPKAAIDLGDLIEDKVQMLAQDGMRFRPGRVPGTHEYVLTPAYILVYRIRPRLKRLEILNFLPSALNR